LKEVLDFWLEVAKTEGKSIAKTAYHEEIEMMQLTRKRKNI